MGLSSKGAEFLVAGKGDFVGRKEKAGHLSRLSSFVSPPGLARTPYLVCFGVLVILAAISGKSSISKQKKPDISAGFLPSSPRQD